VIRSVLENAESLSVRSRSDIEEGGCIIETERGIIDARLANQWILLENVLQKILKPGVLEDKEESLE